MGICTFRRGDGSIGYLPSGCLFVRSQWLNVFPNHSFPRQKPDSRACWRDDDAITMVLARTCSGWRNADGMTESIRMNVAVEAECGCGCRRDDDIHDVRVFLIVSCDVCLRSDDDGFHDESVYNISVWYVRRRHVLQLSPSCPSGHSLDSSHIQRPICPFSSLQPH